MYCTESALVQGIINSLSALANTMGNDVSDVDVQLDCLVLVYTLKITRVLKVCLCKYQYSVNKMGL